MQVKQAKVIGKMRAELFNTVSSRQTRHRAKQADTEAQLKIQRINDKEHMFWPEDIQYAEMMAKKVPHCGLDDLDDYKRMKLMENRIVGDDLDPVTISKHLWPQSTKLKVPLHPFQRTMVRIDGPAFDQAVQTIVETIKIAKSKSRHQLVSHLACCDVWWIGVKPRQTSHIFNDRIRRFLDLRNMPKFYMNTEYLPFRMPEATELTEASILEFAENLKRHEDWLSKASTGLPFDEEPMDDEMSTIDEDPTNNWKVKDADCEGCLG